MSVNNQPPQTGERLIDGKAVADLLAAKGFNYQSALTAKVGGTNVNSTPLLGGMNEVSVSENNTDGALLPPAEAGAMAFVCNTDAGQDILVFARGDDTINGTAGATGVTVAFGENAIFFCASPGKWRGGVLTAF